MCTREFFEYENSRGNKVDLFVIDNSSVSLVKTELYSDSEFPWLYSAGLFGLKIKSARLLGSQVLSRTDSNSNLLEVCQDIFNKTNVSVIVLPALRRMNFKYNIDDFNKKNMHFYLLGGWHECITVEMPRSIEDYLGKLGKKKRYNLSRQSRKIGELFGKELLVREFFLEEHVSEFLGQLKVLDSGFIENNRWVESAYVGLAARGLLHCFVFGSVDEPVAVIDAKKTNETLYVTKIFINSRIKDLSPGATAIYEIFKFIIANNAFRCIDFGYGEPSQKNSSVSRMDDRGRVVVVKKLSFASFWFLCVYRFLSLKYFIKRCVVKFR